jgi:hypothetical protein
MYGKPTTLPNFLLFLEQLIRVFFPHLFSSLAIQLFSASINIVVAYASNIGINCNTFFQEKPLLSLLAMLYFKKAKAKLLSLFALFRL